MTDNFDFKILDNFKGYNSCRDKTNLDPEYMIRGSLNCYKKRSGTAGNRPGRKLRGEVDATDAGVKSSYEWKTSLGQEWPLRVANGKLQFESDLADGETLIWYDLLETVTAAQLAAEFTRYIFSTWWDTGELKDRLLMVYGDSYVRHWSGGVTKVSSGGGTLGTGPIKTVAISVAGSGWAAGNLAYVNTGNGLALIQILTVTGDAAATIAIYNNQSGNGYAAGTVSTTAFGSSTGINLSVTITVYSGGTLVKSDSSTSWAQDGFALNNSAEKKLYISGVEYTYLYGEDGDTLYGVSPDPSAVVAGSLAIQSVFTQSLTTEIDDDNFAADFMTVLNNQACYGSYKSRIIHISADETTASLAGFADLVAISNDLVQGDPDFVVLDDPVNGMVARNGSLIASAGPADWYEVTPNFSPPIQVPGYHGLGVSKAYIITKVTKKPGTGLSGLLAHEFTALVGDYIYYLGKDHQMRVIGGFSTFEGVQFPCVSQPVNEELKEEDFTGGHLRALEDIIYVTAPVNGRHWMYQVRDEVSSTGGISAERLWHPPQAEGISRFAEIDGVVYGHSNDNPQIYQIWNTLQWHDDSPSGDTSYLCVMRMAYRNHGRRQGMLKFDMIYYEGYMSQGTALYSNIFYDYQGSIKEGNVTINDNTSETDFFIGNPAPALGLSSLGDNPLGEGLIPESDEQDLLPKFRSICNVTSKNCFEYCIEFYSLGLDDRWEILAFGTNAVAAQENATFIRK